MLAELRLLAVALTSRERAGDLTPGALWWSARSNERRPRRTRPGAEAYAPTML